MRMYFESLVLQGVRIYVDAYCLRNFTTKLERIYMSILNYTLKDALVVMAASSHVNVHKPWFQFVELVNVVMSDTRMVKNTSTVKFFECKSRLNPYRYMFMWKLFYKSEKLLFIKVDTDTIFYPYRLRVSQNNEFIYAGSSRGTFEIPREIFQHYDVPFRLGLHYIQGGFELVNRAAFTRAWPCLTMLENHSLLKIIPGRAKAEDLLLGLCMATQTILPINMKTVSPWRVDFPRCKQFVSVHSIKTNYDMTWRRCK